MGAGDPKRQPFCDEWERTNIDMRGRRTRTNRKEDVLGRPSATFGGKPVGGAMRSVRVRRDFALCRLWAAIRRPRAHLRCLRAVRNSESSPASRPRGDGA